MIFLFVLFLLITGILAYCVLAGHCGEDDMDNHHGQLEEEAYD